ncbi:MAG: LPXTG cell wall anchor domain-containing protein, partial [Enterococcus sp.]
LPQTNSVKNAAMSAIGAVLVGGIGSVFFWKKRKSKENQKKDKN